MGSMVSRALFLQRFNFKSAGICPPGYSGLNRAPSPSYTSHERIELAKQNRRHNV